MRSEAWTHVALWVLIPGSPALASAHNVAPRTAQLICTAAQGAGPPGLETPAGGWDRSGKSSTVANARTPTQDLSVNLAGCCTLPWVMQRCSCIHTLCRNGMRPAFQQARHWDQAFVGKRFRAPPSSIQSFRQTRLWEGLAHLAVDTPGIGMVQLHEPLVGGRAELLRAPPRISASATGS